MLWHLSPWCRCPGLKPAVWVGTESTSVRGAGARWLRPSVASSPVPLPGTSGGPNRLSTCTQGQGARCALQGLPGPPQPCLAGSYLCPTGTCPRPLLTRAGPLQWQKRGVGGSGGAPHVPPTPALLSLAPRPGPAREAAARLLPRPRVTPRTSSVGRAASSAGLRATLCGQRRERGQRPVALPSLSTHRRLAQGPAGRRSSSPETAGPL